MQTHTPDRRLLVEGDHVPHYSGDYCGVSCRRLSKRCVSVSESASVACLFCIAWRALAGHRGAGRVARARVFLVEYSSCCFSCEALSGGTNLRWIFEAGIAENDAMRCLPSGVNEASRTLTLAGKFTNGCDTSPVFVDNSSRASSPSPSTKTSLPLGCQSKPTP